jgi:hypothetical protein
MFTWICPKCGSEVPPSYSECPRCAAKPPAASGQPVAAPPPQPAPVTTPPAPAQVQRRLSPTVVAILAASGIVVLLGILYLYVLPHDSPVTTTSTPSLQPPDGPGSSQPVHPLAKHLELSGLRVSQPAAQTAKIQFVVVNHSAADLPDLRMHVTLRGSAGGTPIFEFPYRTAVDRAVRVS